jgi:hypothetical protein
MTHVPDCLSVACSYVQALPVFHEGGMSSPLLPVILPPPSPILASLWLTTSATVQQQLPFSPTRLCPNQTSSFSDAHCHPSYQILTLFF